MIGEVELLASFTVPGEPATKGRPRLGRGRTYTPQATVAAEQLVGWYARAQVRSPNDADELGVEIAFFSSTRQRRDIDNMAKLVLDALNGIVWRDDAQIVRLGLMKALDTTDPRTEIRVFVDKKRARDCPVCEKPLTAHQIGQSAVTCSKRCYDETQRRGHHRICIGCGATVYRQRDKAFAKRVYCSPACRRANWGRCRQCGGELPVKRAVFCSSACRRTWYESRPLSGRHVRGQCADCGAPTYNKTATRCRPCNIEAQTGRKERAA